MCACVCGCVTYAAVMQQGANAYYWLAELIIVITVL